MPKTLIAVGLAGLLVAAASATTQAAPFFQLPKSMIVAGLNSDIDQVAWRRCWRDRWGRMQCRRCWRDRWGRVRCR
jgi:hypothetical protein